jgi:hypothetical protein
MSRPLPLLEDRRYGSWCAGATMELIAVFLTGAMTTGLGALIGGHFRHGPIRAVLNPWSRVGLAVISAGCLIGAWTVFQTSTVEASATAGNGGSATDAQSEALADTAPGGSTVTTVGNGVVITDGATVNGPVTVTGQ